MDPSTVKLITGIVVVVVVLVILLRQVNQYERGVMLTMGRFTGIKNPGWRIVIPVLQRMIKVDMRVKAVDVPDQQTITKDNIPVGVNAVIYYKVKDAGKAVLDVENFYWAISQLAQTTMRNAVGESTLDELLKDRAKIAQGIKKIVDELSDPWGIDVSQVELKDIILPENLKRTIAKEAEAERERRAVVIKAQGEVEAAENMAKAATMLGEAPGALHLRTLQSVNDLSSDQSNTTVWMLPIEALEALNGLKEFAKK